MQVLNSPYWRDGAGIENGEYVELMNAYFSRQQNSTKYMSVQGEPLAAHKCQPLEMPLQHSLTQNASVRRQERAAARGGHELEPGQDRESAQLPVRQVSRRRVCRHGH